MAGMFDDLPDVPAGSAAPAPKGMFDDLPNADDHGLAERQSRSLVGRTLSPFTDYTKHYGDLRNEATDLVGEGLHQMTHPGDLTTREGTGLWDIGAGAAKAGLGAFNFARSPISAAIRSFGSQPLEDVTGLPREWSEFAADLATPGIGLKSLPGKGRVLRPGELKALEDFTPPPRETPPDVPRQTPRPGAGVDLLPPDTPHTLPPERRSLSAMGSSGPLSTISDETIAHMRDVMKEQGFTEHTIDQRLGELSEHHMFGEITPSLEADMGAVAAPPGPGKLEVIASLRQRAVEARERVQSIFNRAFGVNENMAQLRRVMDIDRQQASAPFYEQFRNTPITPTPEIEALMPRLQASGALQSANRSLQLEGEPLTHGFIDPTGQPPAVTHVPTASAFQYAKEALDDRIGAAVRAGERNEARRLVGLQKDLLSALDNHPQVGDVWRQARTTYAQPTEIMKAADFGKQVLSGKVDAEELPFLTAGYSEPQMAAMRMGMRSHLENMLGKRDALTAETINTALSPNNIQKMRWAIGDEATEQLVNAMEAERHMHTAPTRIHGGSQTALRIEAQKRWTAEPQKGGMTVHGAMDAARHPARAAVTKGIEKAAERLGVARRAKEEARLARLREEASHIFTLQGPERDAVARYLVGGEGAAPPTRARGGKVSHPEDGAAQAARTRAYRAAGGRIHKEGGGELSDEDLAAMPPETFAHPYLQQAARAILPDQHTTEKYPFLPRPSDFKEALQNSNETQDWMARSGAEGMRSGNPIKMGLGAAQAAVAPFMPLLSPFGAAYETAKKAAGRTGPGLEHAVDVASWANPETLVAGAGKTAMAIAPTLRAAARRQAEAAAAAKAEMSAAPLAEPAANAYKGAEGAADVTEPAVQAAAGQKAVLDVPPGLAGAPGGAEGVRAAELQAERRASGRQALPGLPTDEQIVNGEPYKPGPVARAHEVAERYMADKDFGYAPPEKYYDLDKVHARRIANAYERMKHDPTDPKVAASYDALIRETLAQYQAIKESGLKITPVGEADYPYHGNPRAMTKDVADNNHMAFFRTREGFGSGEIDQSHPMLRPSGEKIGDEELLNNDLFRIVHDYFGHVKNGYGFRAAGEDNAFRAHAAMYSPEARPAMTTETRGQNSWLNYGPHGDNNRTANAIDTIYAEQKAGLLPAWAMRDRGGYYEGEGGINAGVDAPPNKKIQTVADPYRMMYPGIYRNPREIADEAAARVGPEDVAMKRLFGVTRGDLYDMNKGRVGNEPPNLRLAQNPRGSQSAENIQTPANTQRMLDIIGEAGRHEGLKRTDAWYVMDPMYWRLKELFGRDEAVRRYGQLNTMTGMASPGSEVLTEIQRGTAAHWLHNQGRFEDFKNLAGLPEDKRGAGFPDDMRYIEGHPYHRTSQAGPMQKYVDTGAIQSDAPKVPLYTHASGVPETGFQTTGQVGDAHWSRGVGLSDTRKGPTDVGGSFSTPEYQTSQPWWQHKVAGAAGLESVPAQARVWNVLGPQTGVTSELGAPKLELFAKQIMKAAHRLGVSPETARDLILSGKAGAGILAGAVMAPSVLGYRSREAQ